MLKLDDRTLLCLCDRSGIMGRPWAEVGYRVICVDVLQPAEPLPAGVTFHQSDVRLLQVAGRAAGVCAFPPCTHLAGVGRASWPKKGQAALLDALSIADACLRLCRNGAWWFVENPVGRLTHYWGPPQSVFSPHDFGGYLLPPGDAYTKRTCLWHGGDFVLPHPRAVEPIEGSLVGEVSDVHRRSETPRGFARAVFETLHARVPFRARDPLPTSDPLTAVDLLPAIEALPSTESLRPAKALRPADGRGCERCGQPVFGGRCDRRFCSARCRISAHRASKSAA